MRKSHMLEDPYISFIRQGLNKSGKNQTGLARHLGLDPSAISKVLGGKRKLSTSELAQAAEYLEEALPSGGDVTANRAGIVLARVAGKVEAGSFREVDDFDQTEPDDLPVPADPVFPNARLLLFDVEGDSMNALQPVPILPGSRVTAVAFEDIADRYPLRDGMIVVVERTRDGGLTREWSIKQVRYFADRVEFHPRSSNRKHKPIIVANDLAADDGAQVEVIALVRGLYTPLGAF